MSEPTILDILKDHEYRNYTPKVVASKVRIPGTGITIDKGDRVFYDSDNDRLIIEPGSKFYGSAEDDS
jgi:hypothetical protein